MQAKEPITALLKRYILNECNEEEVDRIVSFFQSATISNEIPSVDEVLQLLNDQQKLENTAPDLSFDDLLKAAKEKEQVVAPTAKSRPWRKYASIAALFMGIVVGVYFFWPNSLASKAIVIPPNAIILEMDDGEIQILNENGSKEVIGKNGKLLGQQKDKEIIYENTNTIEELVFNTLTVPFGKRFNIKLSDGTTINLNAGTSLKYPIKFLKGQDRKVYLSGEAYFDVTKDSLHPFIVNTDKLDVRVLGTHFNVSSYPEDDKADVVLVEGSVGMYDQAQSFDQRTSTILRPGFLGSYEKGNSKIETKEVVTDIYTSWIYGNLIFRNMTFENILKKMERHYNVSITNKNTQLGQEIFNASYGDITLQKVFEDLKMTHSLDYSIKGSKIIINEHN